MDAYMSDKEQIQLIKDWWKKHGNAILIGIVLVLAISFGWRYWQHYVTQRAVQASVLYEQMLATSAAQKTDDFKLLANHLIKDYAHTPYASLASLMLAKEAIIANNLTAAEQNLQWVVKHASSDNFRQLARIRAARVLLAGDQLQQAAKLLEHIDDKAFMPAIAETQGDILAAQGNKAKALQKYQDALQATATSNVMRPVLQMKVNQMTQ